MNFKNSSIFAKEEEGNSKNGNLGRFVRRQLEEGWSKIAKTEATSFMDGPKGILTLSFCHPGETVL